MATQAIVVILLLNIINPDAQISQYNIARGQGGIIDINYLKNLSTDAYPAIYSKKESFITPGSFCFLQSQFIVKLKKLNTKWYQWNWSVTQANQVMELWQEQCQYKIKDRHHNEYSLNQP
jgi:hypothetical protein